MMTTEYEVMTPCGAFTANWGEDEESPVEYTGQPDAISYFRAFLDLNAVSGRGGALVRFDSLEPVDLYGFCQSEKHGIVVAPAADDLTDEIETEEQSMNVVLDAVDSAQAFTLIGEGAQILRQLDDDSDTFFADIGRLREIIVELGDEADIQGGYPATDLDPTEPTGYAVAMADEALQLKWQDRLDAFFQGRLIDVRNALRELDWDGLNRGDLSKNGVKADFVFKTVGAGANLVAMTINGIADDLNRSPSELAAAIDATAPAGHSEQYENYRGHIEQQKAAGNEIPVGMIEQMHGDERLNDGESEVLEALATAAVLAPVVTTPQEDVSMQTLISIAADSISELRRVDVYRVLNSAGNRREALANYIIEKRPDLQKEVLDVMAEEWPDIGYSAPVAPSLAAVGEGTAVIEAPYRAEIVGMLPNTPLDPLAPEIPPVPELADVASTVNPQRAADIAFLNGVVGKNVDMWDDDLADKIEKLGEVYAGDAEVGAMWGEAIKSYTDFMVEAMSKA